MYQTRVYHYDFRGASKPPLVASRDGATFCRAITGAAPPTVQAGSTGGMDLTLDATNEVQNACFYMGDVLPFSIDDLIRISIVAKLSSASLNAAITGAFGLTSARNDVLASIAQCAMFRFAGGTANSLVLDTRDGTNSQVGVATGEVPGPVLRTFTLDFSSAGKTVSPPGLCKGGKSDVQFFLTDVKGPKKRVGRASSFDMSAYAGNLQLFAQIQKTAVAAGGTLTIVEADIEVRLSA